MIRFSRSVTVFSAQTVVISTSSNSVSLVKHILSIQHDQINTMMKQLFVAWNGSVCEQHMKHNQPQ